MDYVNEIKKALSEENKEKWAKLMLEILTHISANHKLDKENQRLLNLNKGYCLAFLKLRKYRSSPATYEKLDSMAVIKSVCKILESLEIEIPLGIKAYFGCLRDSYTLEKSLVKLENRIAESIYAKQLLLRKFNLWALAMNVLIFAVIILLL